MSFDSKIYSWSNLQIMVLGKIISGARGIKYTTKSDDEAVYAKGKEPYEIMSGNKSYEGELTLLQDEIEALENAAKAIGKQDITDIRFDIVTTYLPEGSVVATTDVVKYCKVSDYEKGLKQNDKFMEVSLKFMALGIERGKK